MGEWSNLTQREKSNIIRFAIKNGVSDINQIRDTFNIYAKDSLANVDYNMAAAKASGFGSNGNGHYPDTFKKPNHPTFSDESIYHSEATPGGRWRGNTYEPSDFVLNQQGGWNQFLRGFYNQEQGTGAIPVFNGGVMLPEVTVTPQYKEGGKIYIKPSKRGTFTAAATKHGKSVQEFARQVLANKENYSPAMVKKANFARNASKWHKHDGLSDTQYLNTRDAIADYAPQLVEPIQMSSDYYGQLQHEQNLVNQGVIRSSNSALQSIGDTGARRIQTALDAQGKEIALNNAAKAFNDILGMSMPSTYYNLFNLDNPLSKEKALALDLAAIAIGRRIPLIKPNLRTSVYNRLSPFSYKGHGAEFFQILGDNVLNTAVLGKKIKPLSYLDKTKKLGMESNVLGNVARDFFLRDRFGIPIDKTTYNGLKYRTGKPFSPENELPYIIDATTNNGTHVVHFNPAWLEKEQGKDYLQYLEQQLPNQRRFDIFTGAGGSVGLRKLPDNTVHMFDMWDTKPFEHFKDVEEYFSGVSRNTFDKLPKWIKEFDPIEAISVRPATIQSNINPIGNKDWKIFNQTSREYNVKNAGAIEEMFHSTGGPLYPFSFQKNPYWKTPVVRYAEGGKKTEGSVDPATIASRQAYAESTYRDSAGSRVGAKGIFQIMQPTLDDYNKANKDSVKLEDLTNTDTSLAVRNWYMDNLLGASFIDKPESTDSIKYGKALAAYNWGRGNVLKALNKAKAAGEDIYDSWGWLPYLEQEPRDYVNFILRGINVNPSHKNEVMYQAAKTLNKSKDTKIRNSQK